MDAKYCIISRRSVRKYSPEPVSEETIRKIVDAARFAPSWKNTQTVRYYAVYDQALKEKIAENDTLGFEFNRKTITRCPVLIVLTSKKNISGYEKDGTYSTPMGKHWQSYDAGIATEALELAAFSYGVGTVTLGIFDADRVGEDMGIPDDEEVSGLIAMGYPVKQGVAPARKSVDELLSFVRSSKD
ncbi:MAG: nitroreductase family protein [Eubacterium sp.]|nr:nitroreductase family protein [Eubacterium sp.]